MASSPEHRRESVRISWLLGGRRGTAKQSVTFSGPPEARLKLALAAKDLVEARGHNITREECYTAILGQESTPDAEVVPTFAGWAKQWLARLQDEGQIHPGALRRYEDALRTRVIPYLGSFRLTEIDRDAIRGWVAWMKKQRVTQGFKKRREGSRPLSATSVRHYFVIGAACLGSAVPRWLVVNPAAPEPGRRKNGFGLPTRIPFEGMFLTAEETALILARCEPDLHDLVYLALRTGMRRGELVALQVNDVLFPRAGGAVIRVRRGLKGDGVVGEPKTQSSKRDLPVKGLAADILRRRVAAKRMTGLVLTAPTGRAWNVSSLRNSHWQKAVGAAMRCPEHPPAAPVKPRRGPVRQLRPDEVSTCGCGGVLSRRPRFHDLRHTHASALIDQGWPVKKIQRRLGHASFQTTMDVYGHLMDLGDDEELDSLEAFFDLSDLQSAYEAVA